jgi:hypothetical protein
MPEEFALRKMRWQLFATVTFRFAQASDEKRKSIIFAWLRDMACLSHVHFKYRLIWVARYEIGKGNRGHYHACVAGLPSTFVRCECCRACELLWRNRTGGFAEVTTYDPARDGVGYVLKIPRCPNDAESGGWLQDDEGNYLPMLSASLLESVRRGPM